MRILTLILPCLARVLQKSLEQKAKHGKTPSKTRSSTKQEEIDNHTKTMRARWRGRHRGYPHYAALTLFRATLIKLKGSGLAESTLKSFLGLCLS